MRLGVIRRVDDWFWCFLFSSVLDLDWHSDISVMMQLCACFARGQSSFLHVRVKLSQGL